MRIINLVEAVDENHLYHYTNLNGLIGIINSNKMYGNIETRGILKGKTTVSFSRIGAGKTSDKNMTSIGTVKIIFDKGKLKNNYKITPYEYRNDGASVSARAKGVSEFEDALILGEVKSSVVLKDKDGDFLGIVNFDSQGNITSITDKSKQEMIVYDEDYGLYELNNGYIYEVSVTYISSDNSYHIMAVPDVEYNLDNLGLSEDDEEYEEERERIENLDSIDEYIKLKSEKCINNISKYIVGIQLSKELYDILYNNKSDDYNKETIERILTNKRTSGLNSGEKQRDVNHDINGIDKLKKFLDGLKIKISWYN